MLIRHIFAHLCAECAEIDLCLRKINCRRWLLFEIPAVVLELKWNKNADAAISQIKRQKYVESLAHYVGNIILVGINYDKHSKSHSCRIERMTKVTP